MSEPAAVEVRDALDELVNQFADPMSFLRELIQNAVDAGSEEVEVSVEREAGKGDEGVTVVRIDDWGEGMTREIIAKRLTRLFSSAKDGDMTKIGKFGIGFVSVFAIQPDAVCVDTSREGETWRVLFDAERSFKLIRRTEPVDGTKIRVIKSTTRAEHDDIAGRARGVLDYWCKHLAADIRFEGDLIRQPFEVADATASVEHNDGFSHIVVAHRPTVESFAGFYNSGLTLIETEDPGLPGIAYKVNSPHLEHTLTRDSVIKDDGYRRVMQQVHEMLAGPLCEAVLAQLGEACRAGGAALAPLQVATARHAAMGHLNAAPKESLLACSPAGRPVTLGQLMGSHENDEILLCRQRSHLTDLLEERGATVVMEGAEDDAAAQRALLAALAPGCTLAPVRLRYCLPVPVADPGGDARALGAAVRRALDAEGLKVADVVFGRFDYPESAIADRPLVSQPKPGEVAEIEKALVLGRGFFTRARSMAINMAHPSVASLLAVASSEVELAAYLLAKQFFLGVELDAELDSRLLGSSVEARWRRLET